MATKVHVCHPHEKGCFLPRDEVRGCFTAGGGRDLGCLFIGQKSKKGFGHVDKALG